MPLEVRETQIGNILTRAGGYLTAVCSHSVQPYRGCTLGNSLCGVGCYVQHSRHLTEGRSWGSFLDVRVNAAQSYLQNVACERRWGRAKRGRFAVFFSSATEPFLPQESRYGVSRALLEAMREEPPDVLIVQSHSARVADYAPLFRAIESGGCATRVHLSIETDRAAMPGLPPHASSIAQRFAAAAALKAAGLRVVITVSPLLPIDEPDAFFSRVAEVADAVVLDHYILGDGSRAGSRTLRTALPTAMRAVDPASVELAYRDAMAAIAQRYLPGRVGVSIDGFAGRFLET